MKRFMAVCLALAMFAGLAYATIEKFDVEGSLKGIISGIKNTSNNSAIQIGNYIQDGKDIVQDYGSNLDNADKTALQTLETKVNTAKAALDDVVTYIETTWSSIE